jgi:hypothetical protein
VARPAALSNAFDEVLAASAAESDSSDGSEGYADDTDAWDLLNAEGEKWEEGEVRPLARAVVMLPGKQAPGPEPAGEPEKVARKRKKRAGKASAAPDQPAAAAPEDASAPAQPSMNDRHRAWLAKVAQEKHDALVKAEEQEALKRDRRSKKKGRLLARAQERRAREGTGGFDATTKLADSNKIVREKAREPTEEERRRSEEERYEAVKKTRQDNKKK